MSYLYIGLVVAYYLYKAYAANKKKQQENSMPFPEQETTQTPPKKGFFDEILEELEKAQKAQEAPPAPKPQPVVIPSETRKIPKKKVQKEDFVFEKVNFLPKEEGERVTVDTPFFDEVKKERKEKRGFARMNLSPKEALKAQIILERKF